MPPPTLPLASFDQHGSELEDIQLEIVSYFPRLGLVGRRGRERHLAIGPHRLVTIRFCRERRAWRSAAANSAILDCIHAHCRRQYKRGILCQSRRRTPIILVAWFWFLDHVQCQSSRLAVPED